MAPKHGRKRAASSATASAVKKSKVPARHASAGVFGRVMHCGAAGEIGRFLSTPDALRFARCGGRALLDAFSRELETIDIGLSQLLPFASSERSAADAALQAVVARSPRVTSLVLSHRTWVSLDTFCNEEVELGFGNCLECDFCELQRLERLGLRNCFRLSSSCILTLLDRCTSLRELDVSAIPLDPYDVKDICQYTDTLCVNYRSLHRDAVRPGEPFPDLRTVLTTRSRGGAHVITCLELYDRDWHPGLVFRRDREARRGNRPPRCPDRLERTRTTKGCGSINVNLNSRGDGMSYYQCNDCGHYFCQKSKLDPIRDDDSEEVEDEVTDMREIMAMNPNMSWAHIPIYPSIIARIRKAAPNLKLAFRTDTERFSYDSFAALDDGVSKLRGAWGDDSDDESQEEPADDAESDAEEDDNDAD